MPTYDFQRSIAQKNVRFVTQLSPVSVAGENYGKVMIFVGLADQSAYFVSPPGVDTVTEVRETDYADVVQGLLKTWLDGFFAGQTATSVFLVVYTDTAGPSFVATDLGVQFDRFTERAYWKLVISAAHNMEAQLALAKLCAGDDMLSSMLYGSHDATMLSDDSGNDAEVLAAAGHDAMVFYHPDATKNPALVQLGETMAAPNTAGIYVGNKLDYLAILDFSASGAAGANLTSVESAALEVLNVAYFATVGNGVGAVAAQGGKTLLGTVLGAKWIRDYVDFVAAVETATLITKAGKFRNNDTYQGILQILSNKLDVFSGIGRLLKVRITAPTFANLPPSAGDVITVPDAWSADYVDNLRTVTVYGVLIIAV